MPSPLLSLGALLLALPAVAQDAPPSPKAESGLKITERFINTAGEAVQSVAEVKLQIQSTLGSYNSLVNEISKDRRGDYKKLTKAVEGTRKRVEEVRERLGILDLEAKTYFDSWAKSQEAIGNPDLKKKGMERLADSRKRYDGILAGLKSARQEFDPFMGDLGDQITFLGHDLNSSAAASLKPEALKLNGRGEKVFSRVDEAMRAANDYIRSLRPE